MEKSALSVPETAKTCNATDKPATEVTAAKEARRKGKHTSETLTTATLRSTSNETKANPD
ncbi:MAG: hypothetical protein NWE96_11530 [Candidatus Bathyarchaeota archaeon]|nr:hypothetical protein [Candidatus Bathyarchaeota archaeon]